MSAAPPTVTSAAQAEFIRRLMLGDTVIVETALVSRVGSVARLSDGKASLAVEGGDDVELPLPPAVRLRVAPVAMAYKVHVSRRHTAAETRRFAGTFDWESLRAELGALWRIARNTVIEYIDADGDLVRVASEAEWHEAQRVAVRATENAGAPLMVLKMRRAGGDTAARAIAIVADDVEELAREPTNDTVVDEEEPATEPIPEDDATDVDMPCESNPLADLIEAAQAVATAAAEPITVVAPPAETVADAVTQLLASLYSCTIAQLNGVDMAPVVRRTMDAAAGEMHLDIDRDAMLSKTVVDANRLMETGESAAASALLTRAIAVWPADSLLKYNAACAASLCGEVGDALVHLSGAVDNGFVDAALMRTDVDLVTVRSHSEFALILARIAPASALSPEALTVQAIFPDMADDAIIALLASTNGNVQAAINAALSR